MKRPFLTFSIATFATALKFSIAFQFLGLLILHKRYWILGASAGLLNLVGFARVGGLVSFKAYLEGVVSQEALGSVDTPDPWDPQSVPRLDWPYLFYGFSGQFGASQILALIIKRAITAGNAISATSAHILAKSRRKPAPPTSKNAAKRLMGNDTMAGPDSKPPRLMRSGKRYDVA